MKVFKSFSDLNDDEKKDLKRFISGNKFNNIDFFKNMKSNFVNKSMIFDTADFCRHLITEHSLYCDSSNVLLSPSSLTIKEAKVIDFIKFAESVKFDNIDLSEYISYDTHFEVEIIDNIVSIVDLNNFHTKDELSYLSTVISSWLSILLKNNLKIFHEALNEYVDIVNDDSFYMKEFEKIKEFQFDEFMNIYYESKFITEIYPFE